MKEDETMDKLNESLAPYKVCNISNHEPMDFETFINVFEYKIRYKANRTIQLGDVEMTYADTTHLEKAIGFKSSISIEEVLGKFVEWYKRFYNI